MHYFFCDASALGKRYAPEIGSPLVNLLFNQASHTRLMMLTQTLGEVVSILVRHRNREALTLQAFQAASLTLRAELIAAGEVYLRTTEDHLVFASLPLIERHSINSTDALVLGSALEVAQVLRNAGHDLVLVAADVRLVRAALAEGLLTFNPETDVQVRLDQWIAAN